MSSPIVLVGDWRGAGPAHWLSLWAARMPRAVRLAHDLAPTPKRAAWVSRIEEAVRLEAEPAVVVAHGLGCIAVAHLDLAVLQRLAGVLFVAPVDPERRALWSDFAPVPHAALPCRSIVVASSKDPYCPVRLAGAYARAWGSEFVRMQNAGHIDTESGHGEWPLGFALLQSLTVSEPLAFQ